MRKYIKPTANILEFAVTEKLASLDNWLSQEGTALGVDEDIESYKTSYNMAS